MLLAQKDFKYFIMQIPVELKYKNNNCVQNELFLFH